ncbi:hypothetical protein CQ10_38830 [Bradyrhizobium valentinum]|uniref:Uncharacterized protein n=1 Tax=Bradyrhizobium valentinum TaxID=1518501 RepID=A0A0R3L5H0_9BRAD|nr:hypothetical protein CP49_04250 [Bradyrhizobium valentinum]KRR13542.1 hypothetical protein CQ10_38830 [Bradyrhizobium valentinum]
MSESKFGYFGARSTISVVDQADYVIGTKARRGPGLRHSSPWPWIYALAISISMWAIIAWLAFLR